MIDRPREPQPSDSWLNKTLTGRAEPIKASLDVAESCRQNRLVTARKRAPNKSTLPYGFAIKQIRKTLGWTQENFAERTGCERGSIACYEQGVVTPSLLYMERFALVLGVPVSFIIALAERIGAADQARAQRVLDGLENFVGVKNPVWWQHGESVEDRDEDDDAE